ATATAVYQSRDGGRSLTRAFGTRDGVRALALADEGAYVATGRGLIVPGRDGRLLPGEAIAGVVPLGGGRLLVATETTLYERLAGAELEVLAHAVADDPFLRLEGSPAGAWALTRTGVLRIVVAGGGPGRAPRLADPPRLELTAAGVERAVLERAGLA